MPNVSDRQKMLNQVEQGMQLAVMDEILRDDDADNDFEASGGRSEDEDDGDETPFNNLCMLHFLVCQNRFLNLRQDLGRSRDYVLNYFHDQSDVNFKKITRVTRATFGQIIDLIKNHPIFQNNSTCQQAPIHWQLACALDRLGNDGQGVSHGRSKLIWGIGQGTVHLFTFRVVTALFALRDRFISWPSAVERHHTSKRMELKGFQHVVGFVDGTTIPLHKKPVVHGNIFMDRKKRYSVNAQVVCDDLRRVIFFMTGHPGSCGDARVFSSSILVQQPELVFSPGEYLLSDSAYAASTTLVPAYKENQRDCLADRSEPRKIERFNTFLAKARVVNEHVIGIMKARWTSLKGMRVDIHEEADMMTFVKQATACVVLHNLCMNLTDTWDEDGAAAYEEDEHNDVPGEVQQRRVLTPGQRKRWEVRRSCLAFHD